MGCVSILITFSYSLLLHVVENANNFFLNKLINRRLSYATSNSAANWYITRSTFIWDLLILVPCKFFGLVKEFFCCDLFLADKWVIKDWPQNAKWEFDACDMTQIWFYSFIPMNETARASEDFFWIGNQESRACGSVIRCVFDGFGAYATEVYIRVFVMGIEFYFISTRTNFNFC